jgi:LuxR family maltose regulon positive regulatory protein
MTELLLQTKLQIPPAPLKTVSRPQLVRRLNDGLKCKVILVCAPAGYGKTTLLSEWLAGLNETQGRSINIAWLSLGELEDCPYRFWTYISSALDATSETAFPEWISSSEAPTPDDIYSLIDTIVARIPEDTILVLDNYHLISNQEIHQELNFFIDYLPPQIHLVISSREEPPLHLAHLRVQDQMVEIRANDLSFSVDEALDFFNECLGLDLSSELAAQIQSKAEGWIAGMKLAGLVVQAPLLSLDHGDKQKIIQGFSGTHHYVVDYLAEQVLEQQPVEVQDFLQETSILKRLTGSLCDAVTGQSNGQTMLERLEHSNLFLLPLDNVQEWYRYHQLFADFLGGRLQRTNPSKVGELHLRAANWLMENCLMEEAVQHALQAKNFELAIELIEEVCNEPLERSKYSTMAGWMRMFPTEFIIAQPQHCLKYANIMLGCGLVNDIKPLLRIAEQKLILENVREPDKSLSPTDLSIKEQSDISENDWQLKTYHGQLAWLYSLQAAVSRFNDPGEGIRNGLRALELIPIEYDGMRSMALLFLGHAYLMQGQIENAEHTLTQCCICSKASNHYSMYLSAVNYLSQMHIMHGHLSNSFSIAQEAAQTIEDYDEPVSAGLELTLKGNLYYEWNDLEKAAQLINDGLQKAEAGGDFVFLIEGYIARARLELALENTNSALNIIRKAEKIARPNGLIPFIERIDALQMRIWLAQGNLGAARLWAIKSGLKPEDEPHFRNELPLLTYARILLAEGKLVGAKKLLGRMQNCAESAGRKGRLIEILILLALLHQEEGSDSQAIQVVKRALSLAESEQYIRIFVDEGAPMWMLLNKLKDSSHNRVRGTLFQVYLTKLLVAFGKLEGDKKVHDSNLQEELIEPLSARELQVLNLLAIGKTYDEIAQELVVALSTVQWHIKNIYQKLNVHSGKEAITIAHQLNLLL